MKRIESFILSESSHPLIFWVMVLIRGIFNYSLPLMDKTEARYALYFESVERADSIAPCTFFRVPFDLMLAA